MAAGEQGWKSQVDQEEEEEEEARPDGCRVDIHCPVSGSLHLVLSNSLLPGNLRSQSVVSWSDG